MTEIWASTLLLLIVEGHDHSLRDRCDLPSDVQCIFYRTIISLYLLSVRSLTLTWSSSQVLSGAELFFHVIFSPADLCIMCRYCGLLCVEVRGDLERIRL